MVDLSTESVNKQILGTDSISTRGQPYGIPPELRGGVHLFISNRHTPSGQSRVYRVTHLFAYRWRSLPGIRRHRASKPQDSSERVLALLLSTNAIEVGMLKVPA